MLIGTGILNISYLAKINEFSFLTLQEYLGLSELKMVIGC